MPRGSPPPSQKNRLIGFAGTVGAMELVIRPEELTRFEPSRLAVQQTLGGAWADSFDRGIIQIRISGTTGWHGGPADGGQLSGEAQFLLLRQTAFIQWHSQRAAIVAGGGDPSVVTLVFIDSLDGHVDVVAPKSFTLRRSKSRPLLMQYQIEMLVLQDLATPYFGGTGLLGVAGALAGAAALGGAGALLGAAAATAAGLFAQ